MTVPRDAFQQYCIAFYNVENFFEPSGGSFAIHNRAPDNQGAWTDRRYQKKLKNISKAIAGIGKHVTAAAPAVVGLAEIESDRVLRDLVAQPDLAKLGYDFIHYDGPDERGMDTAMIYRRDIFEVIHSQAVPLNILVAGKREQTRDILYVNGLLAGFPIHLFVNHWPSRRDGHEETEDKRLQAAVQLMELVNKIDPEMHRMRTTGDLPLMQMVVMGDFNDDPDATSITTSLEKRGFVNQTRPLQSRSRGSLSYGHQWNLFDQILTSTSMVNHDMPTLRHYLTDIYDDATLKERKGKYRGRPARTYRGRNYRGGFSDHFPVFSIFRVN